MQTIDLKGIPEMDKKQASEIREAMHKKAVYEWKDCNDSPPITKIEMERPNWENIEPK